MQRQLLGLLLQRYLLLQEGLGQLLPAQSKCIERKARQLKSGEHVMQKRGQKSPSIAQRSCDE